MENWVTERTFSIMLQLNFFNLPCFAFSPKVGRLYHLGIFLCTQPIL